MTFLGKLQSFDQFGAHIGFNIGGEPIKTTLAGGLTTLCLRALILVYFCMRLVAVMGDKDPQISSYQIAEDRTTMEGALNLDRLNA